MVGRRPERARLTALLDAAREGRSGTLLFHGPPGIGKTELLRFAVASADGFRVLRARGMESESDIPFAGLAELVTPLVGRLDELPAVQGDALRGALALGPPTAADRFTVPAALLSLLAGRAARAGRDRRRAVARRAVGGRVPVRRAAAAPGGCGDGRRCARRRAPDRGAVAGSDGGGAVGGRRGAGVARHGDRAGGRLAVAGDGGRESAGAAGDPGVALPRAARGPRAVGGPAAAGHGRGERLRGGGRRVAGGDPARAAARRRGGNAAPRRAAGRGPRAGRERADRVAGRWGARVPASADALDGLSPGVVGRPACGACRVGRGVRRRGAGLASRGVCGRARRDGRFGVGAGGVGCSLAGRVRHLGPRSAPCGTAHAR